MNTLKIFVRNKWVLALSAITLVVAITLVFLPLIMQRLAVAWFEENGADRAAIGNIKSEYFYRSPRNF
jgi:hypothetical protein